MIGYFIRKKAVLGAKLPVAPRRPHFSVLDENKTVRLFVEALKKNHHDEAMAYLSKNCAVDFDLNELSEYFEKVSYKRLLGAEFREPSHRGCITDSILVMEQNAISIIHLHMIREPDKFGRWKIYGIDKE